MEITNKNNVPETIVKAVKGATYKRGNCDFTVSELIRPAMINHLIKKHYKDIKYDVSSQQYALEGRAIHELLDRTERGTTIWGRIKYWVGNVVAEKRYYIEREGYTIGGKPDRILVRKVKGSVSIQDYKRMGVYKYTAGINIEIEAQLNIYGLRWIEKGYNIENLEAVAMFRDWSWRQSKVKANYPNQMEMMKVRIWPPDTTEAYIKSRIEEQTKEEPNKCTSSETWENGEKFAVMKKGRKSAVRLLDTRKEADDYIWTKYKNGKDVYIEHRRGERVRCEAFCIVSEFCKDYKKYLEQKEE